jgi:hypothetical protein
MQQSGMKRLGRAFSFLLDFLTVQYRSFPITSLRELREVLTNLGVSKKQFVSTECSKAECRDWEVLFPHVAVSKCGEWQLRLIS